MAKEQHWKDPASHGHAGWRATQAKTQVATTKFHVQQFFIGQWEDTRYSIEVTAEGEKTQLAKANEALKNAKLEIPGRKFRVIKRTEEVMPPKLPPRDPEDY